MSKKSELPQSNHHIAIFDEDWEYLMDRFGPGSAQPVGPGVVIKRLLHQKVRALRVKEAELRDEEPQHE